MPSEWHDPTPAGRALNKPRLEGKHIVSHNNKISSNAFRRDTEMPLKPSGRYSASGISRVSPDEEELMRFKEEKEK